MARQAVARVTAAMERLRFNVAIAALMEAAPAVERDVLVRLMAPLAPHVADELWAQLGERYCVHTAPWPSPAPAPEGDAPVHLVVQVDGKVRDRITAPQGLDESAARRLALASPRVKKAVAEREVRRIVHIPDRLANLVVGP